MIDHWRTKEDALEETRFPKVHDARGRTEAEPQLAEGVKAVSARLWTHRRGGSTKDDVKLLKEGRCVPLFGGETRS